MEGQDPPHLEVDGVRHVLPKKVLRNQLYDYPDECIAQILGEVVGVDANDLLKEAFSRHMADPKSPFTKMLVEAKIAESVKERQDRGDPIRLSCYYNDSVDQFFRHVFPEITFKRGVRRTGHPDAAAIQEAFRHALLKRFKIGKLQYINPDTEPEVLCKSIGGQDQHYYGIQSYGVHCCRPILDIDDRARLTKTDFIESVNPHFRDYMDKYRDVLTCHNVAQKCAVQSKYMIAEMSVFDMTPKQLAQAMHKASSMICVASFWCPRIIFDSSVKLEGASGVIELVDMKWSIKDGLITMQFSDGSQPYTHKVKNLIDFAGGAPQMVNGVLYFTEVLSSRSDFFIIEMRRDVAPPMSPSRGPFTVSKFRSRMFDIVDNPSDYVRIRAMVFTQDVTGCRLGGKAGLVPVTLVVDSSMWNKAVAHANTLNDGNFLPKHIVQFINAVNFQSLIIAGTTLSKVRMSADTCFLVAVIVWMFAFCRRHLQTQTAVKFQQFEEAYRRRQGKNVLRRLASDVKNWVASLFRPESAMFKGLTMLDREHVSELALLSTGFQPRVDPPVATLQYEVVESNCVDASPIVRRDESGIDDHEAFKESVFNALRGLVDSSDDVSVDSPDDVVSDKDSALSSVNDDFSCLDHVLVETTGDGQCGYEALWHICNSLSVQPMTYSEFVERHSDIIDVKKLASVDDIVNVGKEWNFKVCLHGMPSSGRNIIVPAESTSTSLFHMMYKAHAEGGGHWMLLKEGDMVRPEKVPASLWNYEDLRKVKDDYFRVHKSVPKPIVQRSMSRAEMKAKELIGYLPDLEGKAVLDMGGAPGGFLTVWRSQCPARLKSASLSPAKGGLRYDQDLCPNLDDQQYCDVEDIPTFCDSDFDVVVSDICGSYDHDKVEEEHLKLVKKITRSMTATLKHGGTAVMKVFTMQIEATLDCLSHFIGSFARYGFVKPQSSSKYNDEKYLICYNYRGESVSLNGRDLIVKDLRRIDKHYISKTTNAFMDIKNDPAMFSKIVDYVLKLLPTPYDRGGACPRSTLNASGRAQAQLPEMGPHTATVQSWIDGAASTVSSGSGDYFSLSDEIAEIAAEADVWALHAYDAEHVRDDLLAEFEGVLEELNEYGTLLSATEELVWNAVVARQGYIETGDLAEMVTLCRRQLVDNIDPRRTICRLPFAKSLVSKLEVVLAHFGKSPSDVKRFLSSNNYSGEVRRSRRPQRQTIVRRFVVRRGPDEVGPPVRGHANGFLVKRQTKCLPREQPEEASTAPSVKIANAPPLDTVTLSSEDTSQANDSCEARADVHRPDADPNRFETIEDKLRNLGLDGVTSSWKSDPVPKRLMEEASGNKLHAIKAAGEYLNICAAKISHLKNTCEQFYDETHRMLKQLQDPTASRLLKTIQGRDEDNRLWYVFVEFDDNGRYHTYDVVDKKVMLEMVPMYVYDPFLRKIVSARDALSDRMYVLHSELVIMPEFRISNLACKWPTVKELRKMKLPIAKEGVPGCGKTYSILQAAKDNDLVLCATRAGAEEVRNRLKEKGSKAKAKTFDSYLMDPYAVKGTIHCDEFLMKHSGAVAWIALLNPYKEVICYGDMKQLPYIERFQLVKPLLEYCECKVWITSESFCAETRRCPIDVARYMTDVYQQPVTSHSSEALSLYTKPYVTDDSVVQELVENDVVLTFTQAEKESLKRAVQYARKKNKVMTVHEAQGQTFGVVHLVRTAKILQSPLFSSAPHILVALTRHTKKFLYHTVNSMDDVSRIVEKYRTEGGGRGPSAKELSQSFFVPTYVVSNPDERIVAFQSNFPYQTGPALVYDVARYSPNYYDRDNPYEPITVPEAQSWYDIIAPGHSVSNVPMQKELVKLAPISIGQFSGKLCHVKGRTQDQKFDYMSPKLRTSIQPLREKTFLEECHAANKRNCDVPLMARMTNPQELSEALFRAFTTTFLDEGKIGHATSPVYFSRVAIERWLIGQGDDAIDRIEMDRNSAFVDYSRYEYSLKRTTKPSINPTDVFTYPSLQTIAAHPKSANALLCPVVNAVKNKMLYCLKDTTQLFMDISPAEFAKALDLKFPVAKAQLFPHLETDISKYDKSQGLVALLFECKLLEYFGVDKEIVALLRKSRISTVLKSRTSNLTMFIDYQRKSGEATTLWGNTVFNMAVHAMCFDFEKVVFSTFVGDDCVLWGNDLLVPESEAYFEKVFNLTAKTFEYKGVDYCSKWLVPVDEHWAFVPKPEKILTKLGRHDVRDDIQLEEYRMSLMDLMSLTDSMAVYIAVSAAMNERYKTNFDHAIYIAKMVSLIRDRKKFHDYFYWRKNARRLQDPSRRKLE